MRGEFEGTGECQPREEKIRAWDPCLQFGRIPPREWEAVVWACTIKHSYVPDTVPNASMPYPISTSQQHFEVRLFPGFTHKEESEVLER